MNKDAQGRRKVEMSNVKLKKQAKRVFSYRVNVTPQGRLFSRRVGHREFLQQCQQRVNRRSVNYVAIADISDFFSQIYHHRLENALQSTTSPSNHVQLIKRLLSGWNETETFGIPISSDPARLLAEETISDVDEALLASDVDFVRFSDDYRIFTTSKTSAYGGLTILADTLFKNHGLSLQPMKTKILTADKFESQYLTTPEDFEFQSLQKKFHDLASQLGLDNWYEPIEMDALTDEQQEEVDALNLSELLTEELDKNGGIDLSIVRFALRRLAQLGDASAIDCVFDRIDHLYPVFPDACK